MVEFQPGINFYVLYFYLFWRHANQIDFKLRNHSNACSWSHRKPKKRNHFQPSLEKYTILIRRKRYVQYERKSMFIYNTTFTAQLSCMRIVFWKSNQRQTVSIDYRETNFLFNPSTPPPPSLSPGCPKNSQPWRRILSVFLIIILSNRSITTSVGRRSTEQQLRIIVFMSILRWFEISKRIIILFRPCTHISVARRTAETEYDISGLSKIIWSRSLTRAMTVQITYPVTLCSKTISWTAIGL